MNSKKYIVLAIVPVALIAGAAVGYNALSDGYDGSADKQSVTASAEETFATDGATSAEESTSEAKEPSAPDFTVLDAQGNSVKLSDYMDKPVVINFWAKWCYPCRSELPSFDKLYKEYSSEVNFLMVNLTDGSRDTVDSVKRFVSDSGYSFPVYYDTDEYGAYAYSVYSIPLTVFIDSDGNVTGTHTGTMSEDTLKENLDKLTGG